MIKATLLEECIFQGGVFHLHAVKRASLEKGARKCTAVKMDGSEDGVHKAAAIEGTPVDFFDDELTKVKFAEFKVGPVHRAIDKFTIAKNGACHTGLIVVASLERDIFHNCMI